jgi:predicted Zn-dependent protease
MKIENEYCLRIFIVIIFLISSCQINPATGNKEISLMSTKEEDIIGKQEHDKIIKEYGIYDDDILDNYINSLGNFLVSTSELSNKKFTFTILDTPIVNAFALPGGYIYLTRGLLALCDNEAQLAGVISHEIGHVTARHSARRYTKTIGTNLILNILNTLTKNQITSNLLGQTAGLYLLSYSRTQEYEADKLALRYMTRAGFETTQMATFLSQMENYSKAKKKILNINETPSELLLTHPNSQKRVREVIKESQADSQISPILGRDIYLKKIDGLIFGHNKKEGFFLKDRFVHPQLGITFPLVKNFYFLNTPKRIVGMNDKDAQIIFDLRESKKDSAISYLNSWAKESKVKVSNHHSWVNQNFEYIIANSKNKQKNLFLGVIKDKRNSYFYRFILSSKKSTEYKDDFSFMVRGFKFIDKNYYQPPRIKIITVKSDDSFLKKTLDKINLQEKEAEEIFQVINDLKDKEVKIGEKIKTIY